MLGGVNIKNPQLCNSQPLINKLLVYFKKFYNVIINLVSNTKEDDEILSIKKENFEKNIPTTAKWILLMLYVGGNIRKYNEPVMGKIRLLKEIFILKKQAKIKEDIYEFVPYKYGPFSSEFLRDLDYLIQNKFVIQREGFGGIIYELTTEGLKLAETYYNEIDDSIKRRIFGIKVRFNKMPLNELLEYVYSVYPYYASNSEYFNNNAEEV